jgi:hypothetical protein
VSWLLGLALICGSFVIIAIVAIAIDDQGGPDDNDWVAERKRMNTRAARKLSGEFREPRT